MDDTEEKWGDSDFDDINDDDDDDTAWKVRKGAIKIIDAIIVTCPMQLKEFWFRYLDLLQKRFIERDDNVKCEILDTFQTLIKSSLKPDDEQYGEYQSQKVSQYEEQINNIYPTIIKNLLKQFKSKNIKVKVSTMKTISVLAMVLPSNLESHLSSITPHIQCSIYEANNDLINFSLSILKQAFRQTDASQVSSTAKREHSLVTKFLNEALNHNQSRIVSDSLRVAGQFVIQLQSPNG